ncbi:Peptidase, U32 family [Peptoniphilus sp. ING2-D1G]|nr:Peptidase, U32 family [Peptoniphilus sp. ING2-D1G]
MKKNNIEILAPAGSFESLEAAICAGANSIYLGGKNFSARASANNFDNEELIRAVKYAHLRNVKIFVVVNILLDDKEIEEALKFCEFLYNIDVDAVILQDLGFSALVKKFIPDLEIHASTQMAVNNLHGAITLKNLGFKRIVLARETEMEDVIAIRENTDLEIEMFIHGALCVSFSGECLMSSMIGGRSGNRGNCAQPCRKSYKVLDKNFKDLGKKGYLISPMDLNSLNNIDKIIELGVDSMKIEGRLKRPEYVYQVVSSYRKAIEHTLCKEDIENTRQIFNRGFTQGLPFGDFGNSFVSKERPDNRGVLIGEVIDKNREGIFVKLNEKISPGDGIEFLDDESQGFKADFEAKPSKKFFIKSKRNIKVGAKVYKTFSKELEDQIKENLKQSCNYRKIEMYCELKTGEYPILKVSSENYEAEYILEEKIQKAVNKPIDYEYVMHSLSKLGDSVFQLETIDVSMDENIFISKSSLNKLRREAIEKLNDKIIFKDNIKAEINYNNLTLNTLNSKNSVKLNVEVSDLDSLLKIDTGKVNKIYFHLDDLSHEVVDYLRSKKIEISAVFRKLQNSTELEKSIRVLKENQALIDEVVINNLSQISILENIPIKKVGDIGLNVFNSYSVEYLCNKGFDRVILSPELKSSQIQNIAKNYGDITEVISHGFIPVMTMVHCPMSVDIGCKNSDMCNNCKYSEGFYLEDSFNDKFFVRRKESVSEVFNAHPIMFSNQVKSLLKYGVKNIKLNLISDIEETINLYYAILNNLKTDVDDSKIRKKLTEKYGEVSLGHLNRGIL